MSFQGLKYTDMWCYKYSVDVNKFQVLSVANMQASKPCDADMRDIRGRCARHVSNVKKAKVEYKNETVQMSHDIS